MPMLLIAKEENNQCIFSQEWHPTLRDFSLLETIKISLARKMKECPSRFTLTKELSLYTLNN